MGAFTLVDIKTQRFQRFYNFGILFGSALIIAALSACNFVPPSRWENSGAQAPVSGVTVLPQQSLYDVARQENVPVEMLAEANGLQPPYQIYIGQRLQVPALRYRNVAYSGGNSAAPTAPVVATATPRPITGGPVTTGAMSSGSVSGEVLAPPTPTTAGNSQPGLYGSVDVADLPGTVSTTQPTNAPVQAAGTSGTPWLNPEESVGTPPAPGTVEVLEPANPVRAQGEQVASLPAPGVQDVPDSLSTAPIQTAVPIPRPAAPALDVTEPVQTADPVQTAEPVQTAAIVVPEPKPAQELEPVPVPDLPADVPAATVEPAVPVEPQQPEIAPASVADLPPIGERDFGWPVTGEIISTFGAGETTTANDGINIRTSQGTEILASQDGFVVYAGNELAGFGNLILIRHANNWVTGYAHADQMLVGKDEFVRAGQVIGTVGTTGSVNEPQLHFEIRKGTEAVDPSNHLPPMPL